MFRKTNIEERLLKSRAHRIASEDILREVQQILAENEKDRKQIKDNLANIDTGAPTDFQLDKLDPDRIYHLQDIKKICVLYRLRFLDAHYFKGNFPEEVVSYVHKLEKHHETSVQNFKILAPSKLLKLENADDPLLFTPMGNNYFYLIHKWGKDLNAFRKIAMWPFRNLETLVVAMLVGSALFTAIMPMNLFTKEKPSFILYFILFLFVFKGVAGIVLYIGFAKGKNFNEAIWNSKYYNA